MRIQNIENKTSLNSMHASGASLDIFSNDFTIEAFIPLKNEINAARTSTEQKIEMLKKTFSQKTGMHLAQIDSIVRKKVFDQKNIEAVTVDVKEMQRQTIFNIYAAQNHLHIVEFEISTSKVKDFSQHMRVCIEPFINTPQGESLESDYKFELVCIRYPRGNSHEFVFPIRTSVKIDDEAPLTQAKIELMVDAHLIDIFNSFELVLQP